MFLIPDLLDWIILIFQHEGYYNPATSTSIFIAILVMGLLGVLLCYYGYRIYKFIIGLFALILGFVLGVLISAFVVDTVEMALIIGVIAGVVLCILAVKLYYLGIFVFAGFVSFIILLPMIQDYTIAIIAGIVIGVIVAVWHKVLLIISFSLTGAYILANASSKLFSFITYQAKIDLPYAVSYIVLAIFFIIYLVTGIIYQFKRAKEHPIDNNGEIQRG